MTQDPAKPLTVSQLIEVLSDYDKDLPVLIRMSEPIYAGEDDQIDYWQITPADIQKDYVCNPKTKEEYQALLIGEDRI